MTIHTYTPDMMHPLCPTCGRAVPQDTNTPEEPWQGACAAGHTFTYQLDDED